LKRLEIKGVKFAEVTLHVGLGTFNPVEVEDLSKHKMDSEELIITQDACDIVNDAKVKKKTNLRCRNNFDACYRKFGFIRENAKSI
jgi:S-adenosylmethionine:tRNA-ribosyltransferase-isomerase (queuine synthetase)